MFIFGFIIFYITFCITLTLSDGFSKEEKTTLIISFSIGFIFVILGLFIVLNK